MYMQIYIYLKILYKGNDQYLINMYMYFNNCMYLKRFFIYEFLMIYKNVKEKKKYIQNIMYFRFENG